ncbi:hypothetical protein HHI36_007470 [Cryptolaemus montrouzieri]|uniref:N-acetyltransferase domain-containing protein n=2 Tax=Cryptolaemus montrouzieri TaxID=559131 RepID=A0ABD2MQ19_9CUCU
MKTSASDILVELTIQDMLELKEKYAKVNHAHYVHTMIDLAIKWRQKYGNERITITSPKNSWKTDGSIVILLDAEVTGIFPYSLGTYENVRQGLLETKRIPKEYLYFANIHENYEDIIEEVVEKMNKKIYKKHENFLYEMSIDEAKALEIKCPPGTYIKKLTKEHVGRINDLWPHKYENSDKAIAVYIEYNGGYGLFSKDNELMSWALQGPLGHINLLQTEEKYKGKGYGSIMVQAMAKKIAEDGYIPVATVIVHNTPSVNLFNKLGFKIIAKSYFLEIISFDMYKSLE